MRHAGQSGAKQRATCDQYPPRTNAIGQHAGEGLGHTPDQIGQRHRQSEHLAPPAIGQAHGLQEQTETMAYAQRQGEDHAATDQRQRGRRKRRTRDFRGLAIGLGLRHFIQSNQ